MEWIYPFSIIWLFMMTRLAVVVADGIGKKLSIIFGEAEDEEAERLKLLAINTRGLKVKINDNGINLFTPLIILIMAIPLLLNLWGCLSVEEYTTISGRAMTGLWVTFAVDVLCWLMMGAIMFKTVQVCSSEKHSMDAIIRYMQMRRHNKFVVTIKAIGKLTTTIMFLASLQLFMHLFL